MSKTDTPFHKGQQAFHAGEAIDANPHDPNHRTDDPEDWPWDHANWRDGWTHAQANKNYHDRMKHKEQHHA